jgi:KipI family sensor histidine kinase inhibitor
MYSSNIANPIPTHTHGVRYVRQFRLDQGHEAMSQPRIFPFGDAALVCEAPPPATLECQRRVWATAEAARDWPHVLEVVPGMNNLTLVFDSLEADRDALVNHLQAAWDAVSDTPATGREVEIPVQYGGEFGPDLRAVADHTGLSVREVVQRHAAGEYVVFFLGFQPGFAYMGGLDERRGVCIHRAVRRRGWKCRPVRSASAVSRPAFIRPPPPAAGS